MADVLVTVWGDGSMREHLRRVEEELGVLASIVQLREVEKSFDEFIERETKRAREPSHAS